MENTTRKFEVTPSQYQVFRVSVLKPTNLRLRLIATGPVNLVLLSQEEMNLYESGKSEYHFYTASWGRKSDLETSVRVASGTWYLVVEGSTEQSVGRIEISY